MNRTLPTPAWHHSARAALRLAALCALALLPAVAARAQQQQPDLKKEIEELKAGQQAIQKELQEIRRLLLARPAAAAAAAPAKAPAPAEQQREIVFDTTGAYSKGDPGARLTLIEFSDYQCPFCARYAHDTYPQLDRDYVRTGKVRYVFLDFPLESIHPQALMASEAANCAGEQGRFWEMHDRLFGDQTALAAPDLARHAEAVGLDAAKFTQCVGSGRHAEGIRRRMSEVVGLGVTGTPTFFVGLTKPGDPKVRVIRALRGAASYANFKEVLDAALASAP